jgi:RecA-family ATPase
LPPRSLEGQIKEAIERRKPDLVALDPFVKTHALEENDAGDMDFVCSLLAQLAIERHIAVDVPHHVHKGQIIPGDADSGRGSSGIRDAGRLVYTLAQRKRKSEAERFRGLQVNSATVRDRQQQSDYSLRR